jgi:hypothetical protein
MKTAEAIPDGFKAVPVHDGLPPAMRRSTKIRPEHRWKPAIVYVRQSSPREDHNHSQTGAVCLLLPAVAGQREVGGIVASAVLSGDDVLDMKREIDRVSLPVKADDFHLTGCMSGRR